MKNMSTEQVQGMLSYIEALEEAVRFWTGEGEDKSPELIEWKELAELIPADRTPEQVERLRKVTRMYMVKGDASILAGILDSLGFNWDLYIENGSYKFNKIGLW